MSDYCSNKVTFSGENQEVAIEHFAGMGYDAPPFYAILIDDSAVYFDSRWIPPQRDLNEVAERFDVSYDITYQLPDERQKQKYHYTCMQQEPLRRLANKLRLQIKNAAGSDELGDLENRIHEQGDLGKINLHERGILTQLLGKKIRTLTGRDNPWEAGEQGNFRGPGR